MYNGTMKKVLVSVVIPAYRADRYIGEALTSVFSQTVKDWEILVVDDGNSAATEALVKEIAEKAAGQGIIAEDQVRYLRNEKNLGAAGSRNRGVREARGEWIAFLDADDAWLPEKLEKQFRAADAHLETVLLFTGSSFMDEESRPLSHILHVPETVSYRELLHQNLISCSSVLAKRGVLFRHPMPEIRGMHEDYACWLKILSDTCIPAVGVDEPLLIYRVSLSSQSGNKKKAAVMNWNVYRHIGLSLPACVYYEFCYGVNGLKKWSRIRQKK